MDEFETAIGDLYNQLGGCGWGALGLSTGAVVILEHTHPAADPATHLWTQTTPGWLICPTCDHQIQTPDIRRVCYCAGTRTIYSHTPVRMEPRN